MYDLGTKDVQHDKQQNDSISKLNEQAPSKPYLHFWRQREGPATVGFQKFMFVFAA